MALAPAVMQLVVWALLAALAWFLPPRVSWGAERGLARLSRRLRTTGGAMLLCGIVGFLVSMGLTLCVRRPEPAVHDEFCYLLAADTYAHGRLTNPTPLHWQHFEACHLIVRPTYQAKYPPGQGMILAVGQLLGSDPVIGLWLSAGLAAAVCCWMLRAFVPLRWALLGGLLCALHPMTLKWAQSFWGGHVAWIGGMLLLGAVRRITERQRSRDAFLMGLGIAVLAISRPYEGALVTLCTLVPLLQMAGREFSHRGISALARLLRRVAAPVVAVLLLTGAGLAYYNTRVTGSPARMPYMVHEKAYDVVPLFLWGTVRPAPPTLRHGSMKAISLTWAVPDFHRKRDTLGGFLRFSLGKIRQSIGAPLQLFDLKVSVFDRPSYYTGFAPLRYVLVLLLPGAILAWRRDSWFRFVVLSSAAFLIGLLPSTYYYPHYAAPAGGLAAVLLVVSWRHLRVCRWRGRRIGLTFAWLLAALYLGSFAYSVIELAGPSWQAPGKAFRRPVINQLQAQGGRHLVLVDYRANYFGDGEWVYNGADLSPQSASPILWARYLTKKENRQLRQTYPERSLWVLQVTAQGNRLRPYRPDQDESGL